MNGALRHTPLLPLASSDDATNWLPRIKLAAGFVGGALIHFLQTFVTHYASIPDVGGHGSRAVQAVKSFWSLIESRPVATAIFLLYAYLAFRKRAKPSAWSYAFVAGVMYVLSYFFPLGR